MREYSVSERTEEELGPSEWPIPALRISRGPIILIDLSCRIAHPLEEVGGGGGVGGRRANMNLSLTAVLPWGSIFARIFARLLRFLDRTGSRFPFLDRRAPISWTITRYPAIHRQRELVFFFCSAMEVFPLEGVDSMHRVAESKTTIFDTLGCYIEMRIGSLRFMPKHYVDKRAGPTLIC